MARSYYDKDLKLLFGLSAARCAFPMCREPVIVEKTDVDPAVLLGQIAHIVAHSDNGPRSDRSFPKELRDRYDNLILLCSTHHDQVDGQPNTFTVAHLRQWKTEHEKWVQERLAKEMPLVTFSELEIVTNAVIATAVSIDTDFVITSPAEKMRRNSLTAKSHFQLMIGLSKAKEVGQFVEYISVHIPTFPEQLTAGFRAAYSDFRSSGLQGDALFQALCDFASGGSTRFERQAAGIAVISYLFEKCDIFER